MAGAEWDICAVAGGRCTHGAAAGVNLTAIDHLRLPAPGEYTLKLWLRDEAGNQDPRLSAAPLTLRYDDASPELAFEPAGPDDPTLVAVRTSDRGPGWARADLDAPPRPRPTAGVANHGRGGRLVAHIDDEHLGDGVFELQARAADLAGNERSTDLRSDGTKATVTLPLRLKTRLRAGVVQRRGHRSRLARSAYARYGQLVRVRGRLTSPEGNPLQDFEVQAWTQIRDGSAPPRLIATVKTSRTGRFSFLVRKGPSRIIRIRYAGAAQIRGVTKMVVLNVRSRTTISPTDTAWPTAAASASTERSGLAASPSRASSSNCRSSSAGSGERSPRRAQGDAVLEL